MESDYNTSNTISTPSPNHEFYVVSPTKFMILFLGTFGIYSIYWFYQNWTIYRAKTGEKVWPVMRGIFSIFFIRSLYKHIENQFTEKRGEQSPNLISLANIYIVATVAASIFEKIATADKFAHLEINPLLLSLLTYISIPITCWVLYKAQLVVNVVSDDPNGDSNKDLNTLNYAWLLVGLIFWSFFFIDIFSSLIKLL